MASEPGVRAVRQSPVPLHAELLRQADERFAELAAYEDNWDSYGGEPLTAEAQAAARRLLHLVCARHGEADRALVRPVAIAPTPDGGVIIDWERPGQSVSIIVYGDGTFGYLTSVGLGASREFTESDSAPQDTVLALIERLLGSPAEA
jgi:hypothetical protein